MTKKVKHIGNAAILLIAMTILLNEFIFKRNIKPNHIGFFPNYAHDQQAEKNKGETLMTPKNTPNYSVSNSFFKQDGEQQKSELISPNAAIEIVETIIKRVIKESIGPTGYDTNQLARVVLTNARYVVSFLEWPDPYRYAQTNYNIHGSVDAKTGAFLGIRHSGGGCILESDPKTKHGKTEEEEKANQTKMLKALVELGVRVKRGELLGDKANEDMIPKNVALRTARQHVISRNRDFDPNNEPQVILLDDVYIVVFWRHPDLLIIGGKTYDSRVGVDVFTGKVIAMEITRHPKNNLN